MGNGAKSVEKEQNFELHRQPLRPKLVTSSLPHLFLTTHFSPPTLQSLQD